MDAGVSRFVNVEDARRQARRRLPRPLFDFVDGGAEDEVTLRANRAAFESLALSPRVATAMGDPSLSTTVLGSPISLPLLLAPCGLIRSLHADGEAGTASAAHAEGTIAVTSTMSSQPLEDVARNAGNPWFQLYFVNGREGTVPVLDRAAAAGFGTLVVTVDSPVAGRRERDVRHGVNNPLNISVRNARRFGPQFVRHPRWAAQFVRGGLTISAPNIGDGSIGPSMIASVTAAPPTWDDVAWAAERWPGPTVVKGVLAPSDARRALDAGASGVVVSNHGGRQLDGAPATARVLPSVVAEVGTDGEVYVDGGVRRGADIARALALGARAVLVGRPYLYGLAVGGHDGVRDVIAGFRSELARTMRLLGCPDVQALDASYLVDGPLPAAS